MSDDPLTPKIRGLKDAIGSDSTLKKVYRVVSSTLANDAKESGAVPFKTGYLSDSPFRNTSSFSKGEDRWDVPYAEVMYRTGGRTGVPGWDIVTWDRNESDYQEMANKIIDNEVDNVL